MGNLFDRLRDTTYGIVLNTLGYAATWSPSDGSPVQMGTVLLNKPTQKEDVSDEDYAAVTTKCEYLDSIFPGLFEAVQKGGSEVLNVNGTIYYAYKADRKYDGETVILQIEAKR